jgi:DNA-binding GntR family transcriptional regulator
MLKKADRGPKSLGEVVTARLRREIVEGEFEFGQALSESMIAARYEVSRTPVREAFACLGLEGLVRTEPQHGTFVFTMSPDEFHQLSETRAILETAALRLAVSRNKKALVKTWRQIVSDMGAALRSEDAKRYTGRDGDFHLAILELADNPFLAAAGQSFAAKLAAVRHRQGSQPEHMEKSFREHVELLELVERDDLERAITLLERHICEKGESFWAASRTIPKSRWQRISELAD